MNTNPASKLSTAFKLLALAGVATTVVACGGGGSSSTLLTVSGTAATGKALDGAAIAVTCKTGSGSATSGSDGAYTANITDGKGPCVLTATKGTTTLRSISPGAGVANITPLTDLLTNYLATRAGTSVSNLLSSTNGTAILSDTKAISDAQTNLVNVIKTNYGVTISTTNFLTATITTPQSQGSTQSAADKDLDILKTANVITTEGKPDTTVITTVTTEAQKTTPYVATTGASGT